MCFFDKVRKKFIRLILIRAGGLVDFMLVILGLEISFVI